MTAQCRLNMVASVVCESTVRMFFLLCAQAIGFDMDYTLSQYRPETFEVLAYNLTISKLVNNFNYPKVSPTAAAPLCHTWMLVMNSTCPAAALPSLASTPSMHCFLAACSIDLQ